MALTSRFVLPLALGAALVGPLPLSGCTSSSPAPSDPCTRDYWVATAGSDEAGDGSATRPFRTIERAQRAVRADTARGQCKLQVNIRSGTYPLAAPLRFGPEDSGAQDREVVYRAAPGSVEPVVLSGGIVVEGFTCANGVCSAPVPGWPAGLVARQLWVDGVRAVRARSDYDPTRSIQAANPVYARTAVGYEVPLHGVAPALAHPEWAEVVTVTQWKMMRCPLQAVPGTTLLPDPLCWWNANTYQPPWNFQLLSWIENAPEYMDQPGMWFLDPATGTLQIRQHGGTTPGRAIVPRLESLVEVTGRPGEPVSHLSFRGLQFSHATWSGPNRDGYVADQSGNFVTGPGHVATAWGHQKVVHSTPGNVSVTYARNVTFEGNVFTQLGAVGLWLGTGTQDSVVAANVFSDLASSAIQVGGVDLAVDVRADARSITSGNVIHDNDISYTGQDYYDSAGIFVMFAAGTTIEHNTIRHTPWSSVAIGWGWGLLDEGGWPGSPYAKRNEWGLFTTPTVQRGNRIVANRFSHFLEQLWDGGSVYVNGSQGTRMEDGLLLQLNVAEHKRPGAGGNVFYTDAGSRFVTLDQNVSLDNPVGTIDLGSCLTPSTWAGPGADALLAWLGDTERTRFIIALLDELDALCAVTRLQVSYGAEMGGCVPRGHLTYTGNYLADPNNFFDICTHDLDVPLAIPDVVIANHAIQSSADVPAWILEQAGKR